MRTWFCLAVVVSACGGYPEPVKNQRPAGWVLHDPQAVPADSESNASALAGSCEQNEHVCLDAKANGACPDKRTLYDALGCVDATKICCDGAADSACAEDAPTCDVCGMSTTAVCGDFGWECPPAPSTCPGG